MKGTRYHVFFDTCVLRSEKDYVAVPSQYDWGDFTDIHYYVSHLCIEELAQQLLEEVEEVETLPPKLERFYRVPGVAEAFALAPSASLLAHYRTSIKATLSAAHVTVFNAPAHSEGEQLELFSRRHEGDYKDAMIIASAVAYAAAHGLRHCVFLSNEKKVAPLAMLADALGSRLRLRTSVIRPADLSEFIHLDYSMMEAVTALLLPEVEEFAASKKRELVERAQIDPDVLGPGKEQTMQRFKQLHGRRADLAWLEGRCINFQPALIESVRGGERMRVTFRTLLRFAAPGFARLYEARGEAEVMQHSDRFINASVEKLHVNWHPVW